MVHLPAKTGRDRDRRVQVPIVAQFQGVARTLVDVTLRLLCFAAVREIVGHSEVILEVPEHVRTIGDLAAHLETAFAGLSGRLDRVRWARNEEFVGLDEPIREGDVVAVIPPVAGGSCG